MQALLDSVIKKLLQFSLGKELGAGLMLLRLILKAIEKQQTRDLALFVFNRLPLSFREPAGPAKEKEFIELVEAGEVFVRKLQAVSLK